MCNNNETFWPFSSDLFFFICKIFFRCQLSCIFNLWIILFWVNYMYFLCLSTNASSTMFTAFVANYSYASSFSLFIFNNVSQSNLLHWSLSLMCWTNILVATLIVSHFPRKPLRSSLPHWVGQQPGHVQYDNMAGSFDPWEIGQWPLPNDSEYILKGTEERACSDMLFSRWC